MNSNYDITIATLDALQEAFPRPEPSAQFCEDCGFAWSVHDNSDPGTKLPFGCPTEIVARLRWGR